MIGHVSAVLLAGGWLMELTKDDVLMDSSRSPHESGDLVERIRLNEKSVCVIGRTIDIGVGEGEVVVVTRVGAHSETGREGL